MVLPPQHRCKSVSSLSLAGRMRELRSRSPLPLSAEAAFLFSKQVVALYYSGTMEAQEQATPVKRVRRTEQQLAEALRQQLAEVERRGYIRYNTAIKDATDTIQKIADTADALALTREATVLKNMVVQLKSCITQKGVV